MNTTSSSGYLHPGYAASFAEIGSPLELPQSGGWIIRRPTPFLPFYDAMGCYPLFSCRDWSHLHADLAEAGDQLVSLMAVTDPFGNYDEQTLTKCFPDLVRPFKEHFITDLTRPVGEIVSRHRRKLARSALKQVRVEICAPAGAYLDAWVSLYGCLVERHHINGLRAFSRAAFAQQLALPGAFLFLAYDGSEPIGGQICYHQGDVVQCHLAAFTDKGYELDASYAIEWIAIEFFYQKALWYDLGGGAGLNAGSTDGLSQYKRGWSSQTRTTYLCGRIFNRERYNQLVATSQAGETDFFPAYRLGEYS